MKKSISIFGNLCSFLGIILVLSVIVYAFFLFDGSIRCRSNQDYKDATRRSGAVINFTQFNEYCVNFGSMARICFILMIMIMWSLFYSITQ